MDRHIDTSVTEAEHVVILPSSRNTIKHLDSPASVISQTTVPTSIGTKSIIIYLTFSTYRQHALLSCHRAASYHGRWYPGRLVLPVLVLGWFPLLYRGKHPETFEEKDKTN